MKIVVVGSINIDLTVTSPYFPKVGETLFGNDFHQYFGGKGANQAVCMSRLGAEVTFVGCVGKDSFGDQALENMKKEGINTDFIQRVDTSTGIALITVSENDNEIIVISGANQCVSKEVVDQAMEEILKADMVVMQMEIPQKTNEYILKICEEHKIKTLFNPAPFKPLKDEVIQRATFITPNETELSMMFKDGKDSLSLYPDKLIMTCGKEGVYYHNGKELIHVPSFECSVLDTTGAGDTFCGAFAVAICENRTITEAITFGQKASSIAIGKMGAQTAMPTRKEIENG